MLKDNRLINLHPSVKKEIHAKLFEAENQLSILRLLLVVLNVIVYYNMDLKEDGKEFYAYLMIVGSLIYATLILLLRPFKKFPLLLTSIFTSVSDAILISLWIYVTGGIQSPFYLLWYAVILGMAMKYSLRTTIQAACLFSFMYVVVVSLVDGLEGNKWPLILRLGYLFVIAAGGALMSKGTIEQLMAKLAIQKSEEEIRKREGLLKEAYERMEERVLERTRELHMMNQQLKKTNEDLDNFVYAASHDLKSPILNMEALITILYDKKGAVNEFEQRIRERIETSLRKMKNNISNLADVAKAQKEVYEDEGEQRFAEVVQEVIEENAEILRIAEAKVIEDFDGAPCIYCSHTCIKSILYNLISNAVKYRSPERAPVIRIRSEKKDHRIILTVEDNGLGIDLKRNGKKMFSIFKRFHDHVEGAGIGLYTVKKMVEKYYGTIEVTSTLDKGTLFTITFLTKSSRPSYEKELALALSKAGFYEEEEVFNMNQAND